MTERTNDIGKDSRLTKAVDGRIFYLTALAENVHSLNIQVLQRRT